MQLSLVLLWLWCRLADEAPIQPLAQDRPYATGTVLKREKTKTNKQKKNKKERKELLGEMALHANGGPAFRDFDTLSRVGPRHLRFNKHHRRF